MTKTTRKTIRKNLDALVKKYVKERDKFICQHCGKHLAKANCHASHVVPVSAGLMWAYDPVNIMVLCFHCHINWWHKNPLDAADWFKMAFPERWVYIEAHKPIYETRPIKDFELEELYKNMILVMTGGE